MLGARLSSLSAAAASGTVLFFVVPRAWTLVLTPHGRGPGAQRSPAVPPAGARRTSLLPVGGGSKWRRALICLAPRLAACPNSTWSGQCVPRSPTAPPPGDRRTSLVHSATAASVTVLFFVAPYAWLCVLTGAQARLLQVLGARLSSPSAAAAGGAVLFFVAPRAWLLVLTPHGKGRGAQRSPAAPPAGVRRTSLVPVGGGIRWRYALICRAERLVACPSINLVRAHALRPLLQLLLQVISARLSSTSPTAEGGTVIFFVAPCACLSVLTGTQVGLQQLIVAHLSFPSHTAASGIVLFFFLSRCAPCRVS